MSKDLIEKAELYLALLRRKKLAIDGMTEEQWTEKSKAPKDYCLNIPSHDQLLALIQELLDKLKGDAERLESNELVEEVVKVMSEVIEKRSPRETDYFALEMTGDEADNGDYIEPVATGNILFDGCLQMKDIAQAAINTITDENNGK